MEVVVDSVIAHDSLYWVRTWEISPKWEISELRCQMPRSYAPGVPSRPKHENARDSRLWRLHP